MNGCDKRVGRNDDTWRPLSFLTNYFSLQWFTIGVGWLTKLETPIKCSIELFSFPIWLLMVWIIPCMTWTFMLSSVNDNSMIIRSTSMHSSISFCFPPKNNWQSLCLPLPTPFCQDFNQAKVCHLIAVTEKFPDEKQIGKPSIVLIVFVMKSVAGGGA